MEMEIKYIWTESDFKKKCNANRPAAPDGCEMACNKKSHVQINYEFVGNELFFTTNVQV